MMQFARPPEPPDFNLKVRQKGNTWLAKNPKNNPQNKNLWVEYTDNLAEGFNHLCAYSAMWISEGEVDHYLSCKNHRHLAYEWTNYRYANPRINKRKGTHDQKILDPFEIQDDWFEIILPSLQLVLTNAIPTNERDRANFTINQLKLQNNRKIVSQRESWYNLYKEGKLSLEGLEEKAPLIARAVKKQQQAANQP